MMGPASLPARWLIAGLLLSAGAARGDTKIWTTTADFDSGSKTGVVTGPPAAPADEMQIDGVAGGGWPYLWIADGVRSVTKVSTKTGQEVARYDSALARNWDGTSPIGIASPSSGGNSPSRTAIDSLGNGFVANRAFGFYASVTKYYGQIFDACVDRNGNGRLDTSSDVDGDGIITPDCNGNGKWDDLGDLLANGGCSNGRQQEYYGQDDECIAWTKNSLYDFNDYGRGLAVDPNNDVWASGYNTGKLVRLANADGSRRQLLDPNREGGTTGTIYGITIDSNGHIYTSSIARDWVRKLDPNSANPLIVGGAPQLDPDGRPIVRAIVSQTIAPQASYGLAVDGNGVLWLATWCGAGLQRIDFNAGQQKLVNLPCANGCTRGVAVDSDNTVFASCYYGHNVFRVANNGALLGAYKTAPYPLGVGVEPNHEVWTVNTGSTSIKGRNYGGSVSRVQTANGAVDSFGMRDSNYTYSDLNGFQYKNFTIGSGIWIATWDSGANRDSTTNHFRAARWKATVPQNARLAVEVRAADSLPIPGAVLWIPVQNGEIFAPLSQAALSGRYVQVRVTMRRAAGLKGAPSPVLYDLAAEVLTTPKAVCGDLTARGDQQCKAPLLALGTKSYDPDGTPVTVDLQPPQPYSVGETTYAITAGDDKAGVHYENQCKGKVTVLNGAAPTLVCPMILDQECSGGGGTSFQPPAPTAQGACGTQIVGWVAQPNGQFLPLGTNKLTYTVMDSDGAEASCTTQPFVVRDQVAPTLLCPAPQVLECTGSASADYVPVAPVVFDSCSFTTWWSNPGAGAYPLGTTTVTYSAWDAMGNGSTCDSTVTVADTGAPTVAQTQAVSWAPAGGYRTIRLTDADNTCGLEINDTCIGAIPLDWANPNITCVSSSEANDVGGDSIRNLNADSVDVRLAAGPSGRRYRVDFQVADTSGNVADGACVVDVTGGPVPPDGAVYRQCR